MSDKISEKIEVENWLPHGEQLRVLLGSDHISYGEVATTLRAKGVFCFHNDKTQTIPILAASILRPFEFVDLLDASISRESKLKEQPQDIQLTNISADWQSTVKTFADAIISHVFLDDIPGVNFSENPTISFNGTHQATISYGVNRKDYSKDLLGRDLNFKGRILMRQEKGAIKLDIVSQHTSKETDKINDQIIRALTRNFSQNGISKSDKPRRILFGSFTNKNRIIFILRLAGGFYSNQPPGTIVDVSIKRNQDKEELPNNPDIKWMEGAVRNMKIDGDKLNDITILSSEDYYEYFFITNIVVDYEFEIAQNKGKCTVIYHFPQNRNNTAINNSPFTFSIDKLSIKNNTSTKTIENIKQEICKNIRMTIDKQFNDLAIKPLP